LQCERKEEPKKSYPDGDNKDRKRKGRYVLMKRKTPG